MPNKPKPEAEKIANQLSSGQRVILACAAIGVNHDAVGITSRPIQSMVIRGLIVHKGNRYVLTETGRAVFDILLERGRGVIGSGSGWAASCGSYPARGGRRDDFPVSAPSLPARGASFTGGASRSAALGGLTQARNRGASPKPGWAASRGKLSGRGRSVGHANMPAPPLPAALAVVRKRA
jgi:hypothetical protein